MVLGDLDLTMLENSICKSCIYRLSRYITPFNFEQYDFSEEDLEEIEDLQNSGIDTVVEEHVCLLLKELLDCDVKNCNFYRDINTSSVFNNILQNMDIFRS
jgi:hypothetical protein